MACLDFAGQDLYYTTHQVLFCLTSFTNTGAWNSMEPNLCWQSTNTHCLNLCSAALQWQPMATILGKKKPSKAHQTPIWGKHKSSIKWISSYCFPNDLELQLHRLKLVSFIILMIVRNSTRLIFIIIIMVNKLIGVQINFSQTMANPLCHLTCMLIPL